MDRPKNRKQEAELRHKELLTHLKNKFEICRGDPICCGEKKSLNFFS